MKIHIVSKLVEDADGPVSASTVSAHIDPDRAETARDAIDQDPAAGYGVVEEVELDLTGFIGYPPVLCTCTRDLCRAEGEPNDVCAYCEIIDGELPCPIADAD